MALSSFIDPLALSLVAGASIAIGVAQNGSRAARRALFALRKDLWTDPAREAKDGNRALLRIEKMVADRGIGCADRIRIGGEFVSEAADLLANQNSHEGFCAGIERILARHRDQRAAIVRFWENVADAAPAMGMLGTIVGLVILFGQVDDAAAIGEAMAIALLTTLYGLAIANLLAGPIAARLARIADEQHAWQTDIAQRMIELGRREHGDVASLRQRLARALQDREPPDGESAGEPMDEARTA